MRTLYTLVKRELRAYFHSPIAYAVTFIFLLISGYFFFAAMNLYSMASFEMTRMAQLAGQQELTVAGFVVGPLFGNMAVVMLLMMPILTMRLFSEEKKSGSIELLFTWPVTDAQMVLGKYLASLMMVAFLMALTLPYIAFMSAYAQTPWGALASGYLGLFLLCASFLSLGVFVSTLTENQIISAALTFGALLFFWVVGWTAGGKTDAVSELLTYLSIVEHYENLAKGVVESRDIVYYASFIAFFIFLSLRSLEWEKIGG